MKRLREFKFELFAPGPGWRALLGGLIVGDGPLLDVLGLDGEDGAVLVLNVVLVVVVAHKVHLGLKGKMAEFERSILCRIILF